MKALKMPKNKPGMGKNRPIQAYNMAILDDDSAEINMYGEVVSVWPTNWNGEKCPGNFIALDEFLDDLDEIKEKKNITIHINSGGGDLYAGLAIYNRLKALPGNITTINDGMAASAASLILQAGDTRKVNAASNTMAHGVSGFLFGYYNVDDLKTTLTQFEAHNKAIVNVYAEAMNVPFAEAKKFVKNETWLTGQEAVEKGLADEVVEEEEKEEENAFNAFIKKFSSYGMPAVNSATPAAAPQDADILIKESKGGTEMIKTVNELRETYPDLVAQVENAAREQAAEEGATTERNRIKGIEEIESTIADKNLINAAKFGEKPMTAEQLALEAMRAQAAVGSKMLSNLDDDARNSGAAGVQANPKNADEEDPDKKKEEKEEEEVDSFMNLYNSHYKKGGRR